MKKSDGIEIHSIYVAFFMQLKDEGPSQKDFGIYNGNYSFYIINGDYL